MAAPIGNQFWKLRSKHGRNRLFATPKKLWDAACEYFEWCDSNPWYKNEAIKSGVDAGKIISIPVQRPYTMSGLCLYLDCDQSYFRKFKENCSKDFFTIITRVEEIIETQQFEGATIGTFNPNIIARKLGLTEKTEVNSNVNINQFDKMTDEELDEYLKSNGVDVDKLDSEE